jgi:general secretion pathway protein K
VSSRRGVALVLVLWVIVILGGLGAAVTVGSRTTGDVTASARARVVARYAAESGIVAAVASMQRQLDASADDSVKRHSVLNNADRALGDAAELELGNASARVVLVDASARIDVNAATEEVLAALFTRVGFTGRAGTAARAIRRHIDSIPGAANLLRSLDETARVSGVGDSLIAAAAPYLTVDGDGQINRNSASPLVRSIAAGSLINEPSRVLLISRGWQRGHPLTHEVQAVYAIQGTRLAFVSWRERDL